MYSNLLREEDYPLYKKEGILKHATYASTHEVTDANKIQAGRDVFMLTCSRCHTTKGINSITYVFERMYGEGKPLDIASVAGYIPNMHVGRTYMPPFPGNEKELDALAHFIKSLQTTGESLEGVQAKGLQVNSINSVEEFNK
jgi:mono/diheme cytochrome c family protein